VLLVLASARRSYANNRIDPRAHTAVDQLPQCPASALTSIILPFLEKNDFLEKK
jgi:hypothetical protein